MTNGRVSITHLLLVGSVQLLGCAGGKDDCAAEDAMKITLVDDTGTCAFSGLIEFEGVAAGMACEKLGANCVCGAGDSPGIYRVSITSHTTGITDSGLIEASVAPPPQCFHRRAIEPFQPHLATGGSGG